MTSSHKYKPYPALSHYWGTCQHCAKMESLHDDDENDNGDVNKENSWKPLYETPTTLPPVANTNDLYVPTEYGHGAPQKKVPRNYQELYDRAMDKNYKSLSPYYLDWGTKRYNVGSQDYLVDTEWGRVNKCYLPGTDTLNDVEEELLDAYFNCLVLLWRNPDDTDAKVMQTLISQALMVCEEKRTNG